MDPLDILLVITLGILVYFAPTLYARHRGHPNLRPIFLLNIFSAGRSWVGSLP